MGILFQIIGTFILCFSCVNITLTLGWPSSTILLFKSENTTLNRSMTDIEVALFGSLASIGSLISNPFAAFLLDRIGRRNTSIITALIYVMAWSIIALFNRVEAILFAMLIAGCGGAIFLEVTIFISEISQDSIRGTMTAGPNQFYGVGYLTSYFLGGILSYNNMIYACLSLAVLATLMLSVLKESPLYLLAKGRENDAVKSIAFYRSTNITSLEVSREMNNLKRILVEKSEDTQLLNRLEGSLEPDREIKRLSCWEFFKTNPSTRRQFYLVLVLKFAVICQGIPIIQVYAEPVTAAIISDIMSPNLCSVILAITLLVTGLISAYLVDIVGRRPLQIYSSLGAGICCAVLGTQILTNFLPKLMTPLILYIYAMFYAFGCGTVPFVILAEVFLPEVKSILSMLAVEWTWICQFTCLFLLNLVIKWIGLSSVFYFFSFCCFTTGTYFYYFLPETKGLPVYAIQELFKK